MEQAFVLLAGGPETWEVERPGRKILRIEAANWVVALGEALSIVGLMVDLRRLACERLPNGTVIATEITRGRRYVVRPARAA